MATDEKLSVYDQTMEKVVAELKRKKEYTVDLTALQLVDITRAVVKQSGLVTKLGLLTVRIEDGVQGKTPSVARIEVSDLQAKVKPKKWGVELPFAVPIEVKRVSLKLRNSSEKSQPGLEQIELARISTDPVVIRGEEAAPYLQEEFGGTKVSGKFRDVFADQLSKRGVQLDTVGLRFRSNNTLRVALKAK